MSTVRFVAIALTVLTGFSGLVYQVTWQKCLATLLGSHSEATAAVLGIFLGGLSVGYSLFGRVSERVVERAARAGRPPRLLRLYGGIEAAIGVWALLFFAVFRGLQQLSLAFDPESAGLAFALDVGLTVLLIGPPTVLMGGTIPILTQALADTLEDSTRVHAWIYGFNTAGAFFGAFVAGFWLLPSFGIATTLWAMGAINLLAGAAFVALGARSTTAGARAAPASPARPTGFASFAAAALLLGFAMMALQTTLIRVGGFSFGASQFTFAMVVAAFVLCLALGSLAVSALPRVGPLHLVACTWLLAGCFLVLYFQIPNATFYAHQLRLGFGVEPGDFYRYYLSAFLWLLLVLAIPLGLSGATLPLLFHVLRREMGELGAVAGRLYSWNTVGNLLGALLGGYALLFWLDLHHVYRLAVAAAVLAALLVTLRLSARRPWLWGAALAAGAALALALLPTWPPERLAAGLFYARVRLPHSYESPDRFFAGIRHEYPFYDDDPVASVAVRQIRYESEGDRVDRVIVTDGKDDSSVLSEYDTTALSGLVPCLLARSCERAFVVGYGLGGTAGELGALDLTRKVVVAEIAQGVIDAAPHFDYANRDASHNPKVHIQRSDAYRALLRNDERWDLIVSMPSNPWASGVEMLYSVEFLRAARARLAPGGVHAQWLHLLSQMDAETFALIVRTYTEVFEHAAVWYAGRGSDLLLIGLADGAPELAAVEERARRADLRRALHRLGIDSLPALLVHEAMPPGVPLAIRQPGAVHDLYHPRLGQMAARAFFRSLGASLPPLGLEAAARRAAADTSLFRAFEAQRGGLSILERERAFVEACSRRLVVPCVALAGRWARDAPQSPRLARLLMDAQAAPHPHIRELLAPEVVRITARLFAPPATGKGLPPDTQPPPADFATAALATRLYRDFYYPGAPYSREAFDALRASCRDPRCQELPELPDEAARSAARSFARPRS